VPFSYTAFGLTISSELELPELLTHDAPSDVTIQFGRVPEHLDSPTGRGVLYEISPDQFLLNLPDTARYLVSNGNSICIERATYVPDGQVRLYLLGSAFGALLHQRGALPIHGSAIETPRGAVIFTGPSGRGKSTLAWEFQWRGFRHLSDDVSVVGFDAQAKPIVYPAYPQMSLWADVLDKQGHARQDLKPVHSELQKYALPTRESFQAAPVPLFAVYVLQSVNTDTLEITPIKGLDKLQILAVNTYRPRFMAAMGKRAQHFQLATKAGQFIHTRRVVRPAAPFRLRELADLIEQDLAV
jgi:hypothetical protein